MDYGETCVNEYYSYKIRDQKAGLTCKNDAGSCARALCECDKQFAEAHAAVADQYDSQFHIFNGGFVPEESCPPDQKGNGNGTPKVFHAIIIFLTLTRPIGLPPHAPVAQKVADQCTLIASLVKRLFGRVDWT